MRERLAQLPSIPIFMQNIHQIIQWFFYLQLRPLLHSLALPLLPLVVLGDFPIHQHPQAADGRRGHKDNDGKRVVLCAQAVPARWWR